MIQRAIGIDVGGTNLRIGLVTPDGTVEATGTYPSPVGSAAEPDESGHAMVAAVVAAIDDMGASRDLPLGVGIAGAVTLDGRDVYGPNVTVRDLPLRDLLIDELGHERINVVNDANAAAWGESRHGAARGADHAVMVTLGTGVGGGVVVNGQLLTGHLGFGGELGHAIIAEGGWECPCGNRGCLEAYVRGPSFPRHADELLANGDSSLLRQAKVTPARVTAAAEQGDAVAIAAIERAGYWLGVGLASFANTFDPQVMVIGGGVTEHVASWLLPAATGCLGERLFAHGHREPPRVIQAMLGDDAGMIGAAHLAMATVR